MYINRPYRLASHTAYKGARGGVMVKCIAFSYGICLLMLYLPSGAKQTIIHGHQTSAQIIVSTTDGAMLRAHTRANNCLFSAPKGQGNVTSKGPKIIARSFSMVTKENTLRVNCTSQLDLLTDGLLTYYVYRLKLNQIHDIHLNI